MTYRAEVVSAETMGDKLRVRVQEVDGPGVRAPLVTAIEVPLHHAAAYWVGRIVRVSLAPQ